MLKPTSTDCPEYDQYFTEKASGLLNELATKYADLYLFLANVTGFGPGITTDNVADLSNVKREVIFYISFHRYKTQITDCS